MKSGQLRSGYIAVPAGPIFGTGFREKHRDFLAGMPCPDAGAILAFTVKSAQWEHRGTVDHSRAGHAAVLDVANAEHYFRFDDTFVIVLPDVSEHQAVECSRDLRAALMLTAPQALASNSAVGIAMVSAPYCSILELADGARLAAEAIHGRGERIAFWTDRLLLK